MIDSSTAADRAAATRIGVYGGSFDPPHNAHVALAAIAVRELSLDRLLVVPTGDAWHKKRTLSSAAHRLAMSHLAFDLLPGVEVDDRELNRPGPSYTIDTLEAIQVELSPAQLYLIIGADQYSAFKTWHRWKDIVRVAIICIADRAISTATSAHFDAEKRLDIRYVELPLSLMPVSATHIRELVASHGGDIREISSMVPEAVARYISANRLYLET